MNDIDRVLRRIDENLDGSTARLFELLRVESVSTDLAYKDECRRAADWLAASLSGIGFDAGVRPTNGHPMVVAHHPAAGGADGASHVLFYGHYDVQPPDPLDLWETPPFDPRIAEIDGHKAIVARGASDDKGQLLTFIEAARAWKEETGGLPVRVTILLEGEEETSSPSLAPFISANAEELKADVALVCDTAMWDRSTPAVTTMLRGGVKEELTIRAADRDLHSGQYGGAAMNPIRVLSRIIAALHDDDGRIAIPGFYDGVPELPPDIADQWRALGVTSEDFLGPIDLGELAGEKGRDVLEQVWARPTCDVNGIWGGYSGQGFKTVIPAEAHAKISFRLVGDQDPAKVRDAFRKFVKDRLPADCSVEFKDHGVNPALRLDSEDPRLLRTLDALEAEWGRKPVVIGSGGSIPIVGVFQRDLGMNSLMVGFALDDDRIHSPNEKYDLSSFRGGIRSWARIMEALAA